MSRFIGQECQDLCDSLIGDFEDWTNECYTMRNKTTGLEVWTANGVSSINYYPAIRGLFNYWEKRAIRNAIRKCLTLKIKAGIR